MPITLNHSNISVQYSSDKSYIIETVKSDLYRRNENIDTIIRNNIQTASVTPTTYVDSGNVYAVESYTYSGSANTADFTRVFTKNTTCDILVVGGGGAGGRRAGGGGGAGALIYHKNQILNGTYNIKVGKGGRGVFFTEAQAINNGRVNLDVSGYSGEDSQFIKSDNTKEYLAKGGGGGIGGASGRGGSGGSAGGGAYSDTVTSPLLTTQNKFNNSIVNIISNSTYDNTGLTYPEGCYGRRGGIQVNIYKGGGGGGAGGAGMNHAEETTVNDGYGGLGLAIDITGTSVVYAGGGNGSDHMSTISQVFDPAYPTIESRGGGGFGSDNGIPQNGLDGTGGGGGGQGSDTETSGAGGSGIVIIRYLLGTIPTNNLLITAEPTVSPSITSNLAVFTHSGGAETQTVYTIRFPVNTVCDILIIGGGGGGAEFNGGGGAGAVLYATNFTLPANTYTIRVGKGGAGTNNTTIAANNGINSSISAPGITYEATGGGGGGERVGGSTYAGRKGADGGSGGGGSHSDISTSANVGGLSVKNTYTGWTSLGNAGGEGKDTATTGYGGGGGGGAGGVGANAGANSGGNGGVGVNLSSIFGTTVGVNGWVGGGGGGGSWSGTLGTYGTGGTGGGGNASGGNGIANTGGGGGGGGNYGLAYFAGGNGGSGVVIIKVISSLNRKYLFFNYNTPPNAYTLTFPTRTIATINNGDDELFNGSYVLNVGPTLSTIVSTQNQNLHDRYYLTSNISICYHLLNPTLDPIGAQWTYSSNNTNVYHMGSVGIGTKSPEYQLDVRGFIFTSAGGYTQTGSENWVVQSDRRIKENIVKASYEKCLDNVKKIELYNFNFKDNCVNTNDKNQLGFIAQEVQQVYPKAVEVGRMTLDNNQGINDLLTLNTTQIKYTLYGAVKNLIERVENIESRVEQIYNMTLSSNIKSSSSNISITFITPLTSNITANTSNITTNTSNVSRTSNITANTSNITANTSNIKTNTSNITTNTSNI
jgi:hypothetical protein